MNTDNAPTPEAFVPDERVIRAIEERLTDGQLACASAFAIALAHDIDPTVVSRTANAVGIRFTRCQLGLFGYPGKHGWQQANVQALPVPEGLPEALEAARNDEGHLSCRALWDLADQFKTSRMHVGYLADQMGIKITPCQLGFF